MTRYGPHILVLTIALTVSGACVSFDFVLFDDDYLVYKNQTIQDLSNFPSFFDPTADRTDMGPEYLPITTSSFAIDSALYGLNPAGFHLTNVILYALNCLLVYVFLAQLFEHPPAALAGALLFAVHPLHTESFAWISERKTLFATLFLLLSFICYVRYRETDSGLRYALAMTFFVLAFLSKYTVASMPLALVLYDVTLARRSRSLGATVAATLPFFVVAAGMTWLATWIATRYEIIRSAPGHLELQLLNDPVIVAHYLRLLFLPFELCAYYLWPVARTPGFETVVGYLVVLLLLATCWFTRKRAPHLSFAVSWFFIALLPVLNFVPKGVWFAERYVYLATIGLAIAVGWFVQRCFDERPRLSQKMVTAATLVTVSLLGATTVSRSFVWADSQSLWSNTLEHPLGSPVAYDQLGLYYLRDQEDPHQAREILRAGIREMDLRGTPASQLALRMRFHRLLCHLALQDHGQLQREWQALNELCAQEADFDTRGQCEVWNQDISQLSGR